MAGAAAADGQPTISGRRQPTLPGRSHGPDLAVWCVSWACSSGDAFSPACVS